MESIGWLIALAISLIHALGLACALHALLNARTASGAIAWTITLVTFPYLAVPLYWVLSRERFYGYVKLRRAHTLAHHRYLEVEGLIEDIQEFRSGLDSVRPSDDPNTRILEKLAQLPFSDGNYVRLLIDGKETMDALFQAIDSAKEYVLIYFYLIADDIIGNKFKEHLVERSRAGVSVFLTYDELGCLGHLSQRYLEELRTSGVEVHPFYTTKGRANKFQYNFRNHRKIAVIDGQKALVGGVNVHDDSMGASSFYGNWRDTHVYVEGPVVQNIQLVWAEDYFWATSSLPKLNWIPQKSPKQNRQALYVPTGPISPLPTGILFFMHCIMSAKKRLWIASPYFIPDQSVIDALVLASLRGVDVRIIIPERYDMFIMYLAALSYFPEIEHTSIRVFRYRPGHPHQKVMLIDEHTAWVGSSNVDNRSMRLNFEGNLVVCDQGFCREVEEMLLKDLARSLEVGPEDYYGRNLLYKLAIKFARLFSPIL